MLEQLIMESKGKRKKEYQESDIKPMKNTKMSYFIYFIMVAVIAQICLLIYRLVALG